VLALAGAGTAHIDAAGGVILPGLVDAHIHLFGVGAAAGRAELTGSASLDEALARLRSHAASLPPDAWLLGH
jgi:predicted amidohydrolase YtcJ